MPRLSPRLVHCNLWYDYCPFRGSNIEFSPSGFCSEACLGSQKVHFPSSWQSEHYTFILDTHTASTLTCSLLSYREKSLGDYALCNFTASVGAELIFYI